MTEEPLLITSADGLHLGCVGVPSFDRHRDLIAVHGWTVHSVQKTLNVGGRVGSVGENNTEISHEVLLWSGIRVSRSRLAQAGPFPRPPPARVRGVPLHVPEHRLGGLGLLG